MKSNTSVYVDRKYNYAMCSCAKIIYTNNLNYKGMFIKGTRGEVGVISQNDADNGISNINPKLDLFNKNEILSKFTTQKPQSREILFNAESFFAAIDHTLSIYEIIVRYFKKVDEEFQDKDGFYYDIENYDDKLDSYLDSETNSLKKDIEIDSIQSLIKKYKLKITDQDIP